MWLNAAKGGTRQEHFGLFYKLQRFVENGNPAVIGIPNSVRQVGRYPAPCKGALIPDPPNSY